MTRIGQLTIVLALLIALLITSNVSPARAGGIAPFSRQDDPVYLIASYYNAIALRDYTRAYGYWNGHAPNGATLQQFAQGFANVQIVQALARLPIIQNAAAGTIHAEVPVVIRASLNNGTWQTYAGCFHVTKSNVPVGNAAQPDPNWYLYSAVLNPAASVDFMQAATSCSTPVSSFPVTYRVDDRSTPINLISSYYDAIAGADYTRAYGYWQSGAPGQTLQQFAQGFAGTGNVGVVVALEFEFQGAAGSTYTSTPLLITATNYGVPQLYAGCIVTRQSNVPVGNATVPDPNWYLYSANFEPVTTLDIGVAKVYFACGNS